MKRRITSVLLSVIVAGTLCNPVFAQEILPMQQAQAALSQAESELAQAENRLEACKQQKEAAESNERTTAQSLSSAMQTMEAAQTASSNAVRMAKEQAQRNLSSANSALNNANTAAEAANTDYQQKQSERDQARADYEAATEALANLITESDVSAEDLTAAMQAEANAAALVESLTVAQGNAVQNYNNAAANVQTTQAAMEQASANTQTQFQNQQNAAAAESIARQEYDQAVANEAIAQQEADNFDITATQEYANLQAAEANYNNANNAVLGIQNTLAEAGNNVSTLSAQQQVAEAEMNTANAEAAAQAEALRPLQEDVNNKQGLYDTATQNVQTIQNSIAQKESEQTSADTAISEKTSELNELRSSIAALENAVQENETAVTNAKAPLDEILAKRARGSLGFFEWLQSKNPNDITVPYAISYIQTEDYTQYTHLGEAGDATTLENMSATFPWLRYCNELRNQHDLNPLKITSWKMAIAQLHANWSASMDNYGHARLIGTAENLAYGYQWAENGPFKGWYDDEKALRESGTMTGTGHYMNIIEEGYEETGFAINNAPGNRYTWVQDFGSIGYSNQERFAQSVYTVDEYEALFNEYVQTIDATEAQAAYDNAVANLTNAQNALTNTEQAIATAEQTIADLQNNKSVIATEIAGLNIDLQNAQSQAAVAGANLETAQQALDTASGAYTAAMQTAEEKTAVYQNTTASLEAAISAKATLESNLAAAQAEVNNAYAAYQTAIDQYNAVDGGAALAEAKRVTAAKLEALVAAEGVLTEANNAYNTAYADEQAKTAAYNAAVQELSTAEQTVTTANENLAAAQADLTAKQQASAQLQSQVAGITAAKDAVSNAKAVYDEKQASYTAAESAYNTAKTSQAEAEANAANAQRVYDKYNAIPEATLTPVDENDPDVAALNSYIRPYADAYEAYMRATESHNVAAEVLTNAQADYDDAQATYNTAKSTYDKANEAYQNYLNEEIDVTPHTLSIEKGDVQSLQASVTPSVLASQTLRWESSDPNVASVDPNGNVSGAQLGSATIYVNTTDGSNKSAMCVVNVIEKTVKVDKITLNKKEASIATGKTMQLKATVSPQNAANKNVSWTSSNTSVATVDNSGLVTAKKEGKATITATATDKGTVKATCNITVADVKAQDVFLDSTSKKMEVDDTVTLKATVMPTDTTNKKVTWASNNTMVATVDASGKVTAKKPGTATISATSTDGTKLAGTCEIKVSAKPVAVTGVSLNKTSLSLQTGQTDTLKATVTPNGATNKSVTWTSSNTNAATVSNGTVKATGVGTATITVKTADGSKTATCKVTVKAPVSTVSDIPEDSRVPSVSYRTHVQSIGWQEYVKDGSMSGTQGQSKRLEGINIKLENTPVSGGITYRTHVQTYGWQGWKSNDQMAGTSGEAKRLEAIQIQLTGDMAKYYDVYYQTHIQHFGWSGWACNGEMCGSAGYAYRLEGIRIKLVKKGETAPGSTANPFYGKAGSASPVSKTSGALVGYNTHVQTYGWQNFVYDGAMSGTSGESKRLEGIQISLVDKPYSGDIMYRTHVQTYGWQAWKKNGQMSGTSGESKRLEGIQIYLTGDMAKHYDVYYRVHAQTYGWLDWAKNGVMAGTSGLSKRLEGINIVLVPKGDKAPGATSRPYVTGGGGKLPDNPYKE